MFAQVQLKEVDLSIRVASFEGVYGGICIASPKGPEEASFVSSDTQLLNVFTPDSKVDVGFDMSFFSALAYLERSNKLWVQRVEKQANFGGLVIKAVGAVASNAGIIASSNLIDPTAYVLDAEDAIFIYGLNKGAWANSVGVKVQTITANPDLQEPNSFQITVFKSSNPSVAIETHLVTRVPGQKDGRGRNLFIEDVLQSSNYIRAISNTTVLNTVLPKEQATVLYMTDGNNGVAVGDTEMVAGVNKFLNKAKTNITLLLDGGYTTVAYQTALNTVASTRMDCMAILSSRYEDEASSDYLNDIVDYRKTTLNMNSSYSAMYTPHLQIQDRFNDRKIWVSPDGHVAGSISFTSQNYEIWFPPAGYKRGVLNVLDVKRRFEDGELEVLANAGINPIRFITGKGIVVWGQKTLLSRASALDRVNVRLLLIVIEPAIKTLLEDFLFDLNDPTVGVFIEGKIEDYLETIKSKKGLQDYDVVSDDTNNSAEDIDNYRRNVDVFIKPTRSTEIIPVRIVITPTNVSFSDAQGLI